MNNHKTRTWSERFLDFFTEHDNMSVSLAAVFWMSRNAPRSFGGALGDIQKRLRGRLDNIHLGLI